MSKNYKNFKTTLKKLAESCQNNPDDFDDEEFYRQEQTEKDKYKSKQLNKLNMMDETEHADSQPYTRK